jgi:hypothetical protein
MSYEEIFRDFLARLTSRKFLAFAFAVVVLILQGVGWINLDPVYIERIITATLAYMGVEGIRDTIKALSNGK